jgi:uncharacterized membrane protein YccC
MDFRLFRPLDHSGLHYAVRILVGTTAVWLLLRALGDANAVWAVISLIMVTEPLAVSAWRAFLARIVNTVIGCVVGLFFLLVAGPEAWVLPLALTATVLVCTYVVHVPQSWRVGPVTAALVLAAGVAAHSRDTGLEVAVRRSGEVLVGSVVAVAIAWVGALVWPLRVAAPQPGAPADGQGPPSQV